MSSQLGAQAIAGTSTDTRRRKIPNDPSPRQPHKSTLLNLADITGRVMRQDGHRTWGYVIYRTTYSSDNDWNEFLRRLRFHLEHSFDRCNGRDVLDMFTLTVFSDKAFFDRATTADIRTHFRQWAEQAWRPEQQPQDKIVGDAPQQLYMGSNPRYRFCVQVDEASLHSIIHDAPPPPQGRSSLKGWVKLISKTWIPIEEEPHARPGWATFDAIDGITEEDIGWMKVPYPRVMLDFYSAEAGLNGWRVEYRRPPEVAGDF